MDSITVFHVPTHGRWIIETGLSYDNDGFMAWKETLGFGKRLDVVEVGVDTLKSILDLADKRA